MVPSEIGSIRRQQEHRGNTAEAAWQVCSRGLPPPQCNHGDIAQEALKASPFRVATLIMRLFYTGWKIASGASKHVPHYPAAIAFPLYGASLAVPTIVAKILKPMHNYP